MPALVGGVRWFSTHFSKRMQRPPKRPDAYEIDRCRLWLDRERTIVEPASSLSAQRPRAASLAEA